MPLVKWPPPVLLPKRPLCLPCLAGRRQRGKQEERKERSRDRHPEVSPSLTYLFCSSSRTRVSRALHWVTKCRISSLPSFPNMLAAALERPRDYRGGEGKQGSGRLVQWPLAACPSLAPLLLAPAAWLSVGHPHSSFLVHVIWEKLSTRPSTLHQAPRCDAKQGIQACTCGVHST